jgi:hypothetical protein
VRQEAFDSNEFWPEHQLPAGGVVMKSNIEDVIADLVFQTTPDLTSRLDSQAEALREIKCTSPALGRLVDANDVNYLLSVLNLRDEDFAEMYPAKAHIGATERRQILSALEIHFQQCEHCSLKRGYDLEMNARIEQAFRRNSKHLLQALKEDETNPSEESEPPVPTLNPALSTT